MGIFMDALCHCNGYRIIWGYCRVLEQKRDYLHQHSDNFTRSWALQKDKSARFEFVFTFIETEYWFRPWRDVMLFVTFKFWVTLEFILRHIIHQPKGLIMASDTRQMIGLVYLNINNWKYFSVYYTSVIHTRDKHSVLYCTQCISYRGNLGV